MNHEYNKLIKRADDESVALKIRCTSCSTTGAVTISDTQITLNCDGTTTAVDLSGASYDTLGELSDKVNATNNFEAVIVDGLRSMSISNDSFRMIGPASTLTSSETMGATGSDGVSFGWDTSVIHKYVVSIQEEDLPSKAATAGQSDIVDSGIENVAYDIRAQFTDTNCTNTLTVYKCVGTTETAIHTIAGEATTAPTYYSSDVVPISAGDPEVGGRLVAVVTADTTHGVGFLEVRGKSINRARQAIDGN